jgi:uncharacterized membrane protein
MSGTSIVAEPTPGRWQKLISIRTVQWVTIVLGIFISGYLSYVKATGVIMACVQNSAFNCEKVQSSAYSMMFGIPIAYMGLAVYIILGLLLLFGERIPVLGDYRDLMFFALALFAWIFSMYLVYIQFFVLEALCPWCLAHEANFTVLFAVTAFSFVRDMREAEE